MSHYVLYMHSPAISPRVWLVSIIQPEVDFNHAENVRVQPAALCCDLFVVDTYVEAAWVGGDCEGG